jgi:hypothetical protein
MRWKPTRDSSVRDHITAHPAAVAPSVDTAATHRITRRRLNLVLCGLLALGTLATIPILLWFFWPRNPVPVDPFAHVIPDTALAMLKLNVNELRSVPGLERETEALDAALKKSLADFAPEPATAKVASIVVITADRGERIEIWDFDRSIRPGKVLEGRYHRETVNDTPIWADVFGKHVWCFEGSVSLVHGPKHLVEGFLARKKAKRFTRAAESLFSWAKEVPSTSLAWGVADFTRTELREAPLPLGFAEDLKGTRINGLYVYLNYAESTGPVAQAKLYCATHSDAKTCTDTLGALTKKVKRLVEQDLANSTIRSLANVLDAGEFQTHGKEVYIDLGIPIAMPRLALQDLSNSFLEARRRVEENTLSAFHEHMATGQKALDESSFGQAEAAFVAAIKLVPNDAKARAKLDVVRTILEARTKLDLALREAEAALVVKDLAKARTQLALAKTLNANDARVLKLERQLGDATSEATSQKHVEDGERAIAQNDLLKALAEFQAAARITPGDPKLRETIAAIESIHEASTRLELAKKLLMKHETVQAYLETKRAKDVLFGDFRKSIETDARFQPILLALALTAKDVVWPLLDELRSNGDKLKSAGMEAAETNKHAAAAALLEKAQRELLKADDFLDGLRAYPPEGQLADVRAKASELKTELASIEAPRQQSKGLAHLRTGSELMKEGEAELVLAKKQSSHLQDVRRAYVKALEEFTAAAKCQGVEASEQIVLARKAIDRVAKLLQPIDLEFKNEQELTGWKWVKDQWHFQPKAALQSASVATSILTSPQIDCPVDFELFADFSMVDDQGIVKNDQWHRLKDFVNLRLLSTDGKAKDLVIGFGKDPGFELAALSSITIGKKSYTFPSLEGSATLQARLVRRQGTATLTVNLKEIASFPLTFDMNRVAFRVVNAKGPSNEFNRRCALYRLSLRALD